MTKITKITTIATGLTRDEMIIGLAEMPPHTHFRAVNARGDTIYANICDCQAKNGEPNHYEAVVIVAPRPVSFLGLTITPDGPEEPRRFAADDLYGFLMMLGACYIRPETLWDRVDIGPDAEEGPPRG